MATSAFMAASTQHDALSPSAGINTYGASSVPATAPNVLAAYTLPMDSFCGALTERNFSIAGSVAPIAIVAGSSENAGIANAIVQCFSGSGSSPMNCSASSFTRGIAKLTSTAHAPIVSSNPHNQSPARASRGIKRSMNRRAERHAGHERTNDCQHRRHLVAQPGRKHFRPDELVSKRRRAGEEEEEMESGPEHSLRVVP